MRSRDRSRPASLRFTGVLFALGAALICRGFASQHGTAADYSRIEKAISEHNLILAQHDLEKALQTHPEDARAHMLLGIVFDGENQPHEAEKEFKAALQLQPELAAAHINLGKHYAQQGDLTGATREFESAIHLAPGNPTAYENLGLILMAKGQHAEALRRFEAAAQVAPREPPILINLLKAQLASGEIPQACKTVARIEALAPPSVDVDGVLGAIQAEGGDFAGAIETLQKAHIREPSSTDVLYNLGLAYYKSGDFGHAAGTLESAQQLKDTGEVENLLGQVYEDKREYVKAAKALQRAIELEPANESYHFDFTLELLKHRSFDAAIVAAGKDVNDFPNSLRLRLIQGVSYFGRGLYRDSVNAFFEAAKRFPDAELPLYCLAQAAGVTEERTDEVQSLVAAYSQHHPEQSWPYYYLGQLAAQGGKTPVRAEEIEKAEGLLKKSIALDPNYAESYYQLGAVYSKLARWPDAVREYRKAIDLKPSLAEAHYRLAEAYRHLGDSTEADKEFQIHQSLMRQQSEQSLRDQDLQTFLFKLTR